MMNFKETHIDCLTDNPLHAIFIDYDCNMINGDFDMGMRGTDHNMILSYDPNEKTHQQAWEDIHLQGVVRLVPESMIALISTSQELSVKQHAFISQYGYEVERY